MHQGLRRHAAQRRLGRDRFFDGPQIVGRLLAATDALEHGACFVVPAAHREPARAFRHEEQRQEIEHGRQRLDTEHPAPVPFAEPERFGPRGAGFAQRQYQVVAEEGDGDADDDVELIERHQASPGFRWRHFGNVHRRNDECGTYAEPA